MKKTLEKSGEIEILEINKPFFIDRNKISLSAKLFSEVKKRMDSLEFLDNGELEKIGCTIFYGNKMSVDKNPLFTKRGICISDTQELKISVCMAGINAVLRKYKEFIDEEKIVVHLCCLKSSESLENSFSFDKNKINENDVDSAVLKVDAIVPIYKLEQLITNDNVRVELENTVKLIKYRNRIYKDWGFSEIEPIPHCVINMYGAPGTGKTMSAHILADELGLKILPLNYADIESKFVGEAPKKLISAFEIAEKQNALLFFDEADSFLGKRITNVSASSDQAINSLRSQLLILLESKNVITVFATNLLENYDKAFHSRILKSIKFELPDFETRKKIVRRMIPNRVPLLQEFRTDDFFSKLAELTEDFSPREIKNAVLNTLIEGCEGEITNDLFISVFKKQKKIFDDINESVNQKKKYSSTIKNSLENNDYAVIKADKGEEVRDA